MLRRVARGLAHRVRYPGPLDLPSTVCMDGGIPPGWGGVSGAVLGGSDITSFGDHSRWKKGEGFGTGAPASSAEVAKATWRFYHMMERPDGELVTLTPTLVALSPTVAVTNFHAFADDYNTGQHIYRRVPAFPTRLHPAAFDRYYSPGSPLTADEQKQVLEGEGKELVPLTSISDVREELLLGPLTSEVETKWCNRAFFEGSICDIRFVKLADASQPFDDYLLPDPSPFITNEEVYMTGFYNRRMPPSEKAKTLWNIANKDGGDLKVMGGIYDEWEGQFQEFPFNLSHGKIRGGTPGRVVGHTCASMWGCSGSPIVRAKSSGGSPLLSAIHLGSIEAYLGELNGCLSVLHPVFLRLWREHVAPTLPQSAKDKVATSILDSSKSGDGLKP